MNRYIAPSLLAADFGNLRQEIEMVNNSEADWFHIDVMDGVFVPNISFGFPILKVVKKYAKKPVDVHLMISDPDPYLEMFRDAGADHLTVHVEACRHLHRTVQAIRELGMKAGVTLNPHSPVHLLEEILPYSDIILIMSVNPGFGGQKFIESSLGKINKTRALIEKTGSKALIEVDGGIDLNNASALFKAGMDVLVTGTAVFHAPNPAKMISMLKHVN